MMSPPSHFSGVGLLFTDAGGRSHGDIWIGVADETGVLLDADIMRNTRNLNLAELGAVKLACDHIRHERGVILTDSLTTTKFMGGVTGLYKRSSAVAEDLAMREAIMEKLPRGWCVAWIPRLLNLADAALESRIREVEGAPS